MDKQEAISFITQELGKNKPQTEIVTKLSARLGAPPAMVSKFVSQVAAKHQAQPRPTPPPTPPPADQPIYSNPPAPLEATPSVAQSFLQGNIAPAPARKTAPPLEANPELEAMIVTALGKSKRRSDVAVMVCEQTGMNWDQAQRTVARVATKNQKTLSAKQNRVMLPLAIAAIIFGIALLAAGISEGYSAAAQIQDFATGDGYYVPNIEYVIREGFIVISSGGALFLGGVAGLIMALKNQFD